MVQIVLVVARSKGKVLNVSSTAFFMLGLLQAVYYASKAFVVSFAFRFMFSTSKNK
ncbi:MAG: SDR family NAD(P)-dependent oxidoreductase [Gammaproteobacteria bacterium]|nr:SDR family NAD(P)-dependent oxidoreductase [Gammaproteobacteria bacterium]MCP4880123.1 SDR family NAD(P)-dependent oxidoreductase [Gammaproteobacteria bacterium]